MKRLETVFARGKAFYYRLKTVEKILLFEVLTFLIPLVVLMGFYFYQFNLSLAKKHELFQQRAVETMSRSYEGTIESIQSLRTLFSTNSGFRAYLEDWTMTTADRVYSYNCEIRPLIEYVQSSNSLLRRVEVYTLTDIPLPPYHFAETLSGGGASREELAELMAFDVRWRFIEDAGGIPDVVCYAPVYDAGFSDRLAYVLFHVSPEELLRPFVQDQRVFLEHEGGIKRVLPSGALAACTLEELEELSAYRINRQNVSVSPMLRATYINDMELRELGVRLYFVSTASYLSGEDLFSLLIPIALLALLLLSILFVNFAAGTKRVSSLAEHLSALDYEEMRLKDGGPYRDEIGVLYDAYNRMAENINRLVHDVYRAEIRSRDARYYAMQAQINPHFLMNTLENIRMTALMGGDGAAADLIYKLGRIMSYNLQKKDLTSTLGEEAGHTRLFLELYAVRLGEGFSFVIDVPEPLRELPCPRFLLQPVAENAVLHAFGGRVGEKRLEITVFERDGVPVVRVRDNGAGIAPEHLERIRAVLRGDLPESEMGGRGHGVGLCNVHQRLRIFYRPAPDGGRPSGIEVESCQGRGTTFWLRLGSPSDNFRQI